MVHSAKEVSQPDKALMTDRCLDRLRDEDSLILSAMFRALVVHPVNELEISNACNFKAVRSIGLCGGLEMMDICERSAGGRLENAN